MNFLDPIFDALLTVVIVLGGIIIGLLLTKEDKYSDDE